MFTSELIAEQGPVEGAWASYRTRDVLVGRIKVDELVLGLHRPGRVEFVFETPPTT